MACNSVGADDAEGGLPKARRYNEGKRVLRLYSRDSAAMSAPFVCLCWSEPLIWRLALRIRRRKIPVNKTQSVSVLCAATLLVTPCAFASLLVNGGFSLGLPASGCAAGVVSLPGWTVTSGNVDIDSAASGCSGIAPVEGLYFVDLTGSFAENGLNDVGAISQVFHTTPGTEYRLSFNFGGNPQWQYLGYPNDSPIKSMDVLIDGSLVGNYSIDTSGASLSDAQWRRENLKFVATGSTTDLSFESLNGISSPSDFGPLLDGVDVKTVPEPGTLSLMGVALIGLPLWAVRRMRRRIRAVS